MRHLTASLSRLIALLPDGARTFVHTYMVATSALAILDIAALALVAAILGPMSTGTSTTLPLLGTVGPADYPWLLLVICALMILKAILALLIQWFATRKLRDYELAIGDALFDAYIRAPWIDRLSRSTAEIVRMADVGIANTISGVLLPAISLPQHLVTFVAIVAVFLIAQPLIASATLVYFLAVGAVMYAGISRAAVTAGRVNLRYSLRVASLMTEMVSALKEITLRNRFDQVAAVVRSHREHSTKARANIQFLGAVPQRLVEAALVVGFALVGAVAYAVGGMSQAVASIALFSVAAFRMMPALISFQSVATTTANSLPHLDAVLRDIDAAAHYRDSAETLGTHPLPNNPAHLQLTGVSFTYPGATQPAVTGIDLRIELGSFVGLVGASGSGKSTLVDLILGLIKPQSGRIDIDGLDLAECMAAWRSRVGYVPQDVALFDATIAQNIALTWDDDIDIERLNRAIKLACLRPVVDSRPEGAATRIGERGLALSGGERQRLGIARALYTDPMVLIMDEATSALDTATEKDIAQAVTQLRGQVTVISVAHRLSTIRTADQVCFMRAGALVDTGTFDELVARVPDFAVQASLAGLAGPDSPPEKGRVAP